MKPVIHGALSACVLPAGCAFGPVRVADPAAPGSIDGGGIPVRLPRPGAKAQDPVIAAGPGWRIADEQP